MAAHWQWFWQQLLTLDWGWTLFKVIAFCFLILLLIPSKTILQFQFLDNLIIALSLVIRITTTCKYFGLAHNFVQNFISTKSYIRSSYIISTDVNFISQVGIYYKVQWKLKFTFYIVILEFIIIKFVIREYVITSIFDHHVYLVD